MELYSKVAILHLVRFAMTPKHSELPQAAATDWFKVCRNLSVSSVAPPIASIDGIINEPSIRTIDGRNQCGINRASESIGKILDAEAPIAVGTLT